MAAPGGKTEVSNRVLLSYTPLRSLKIYKWLSTKSGASLQELSLQEPLQTRSPGQLRMPGRHQTPWHSSSLNQTSAHCHWPRSFAECVAECEEPTVTTFPYPRVRCVRGWYQKQGIAQLARAAIPGKGSQPMWWQLMLTTPPFVLWCAVTQPVTKQ